MMMTTWSRKTTAARISTHTQKKKKPFWFPTEVQQHSEKEGKAMKESSSSSHSKTINLRTAQRNTFQSLLVTD
jgi:hypothetical protein